MSSFQDSKTQPTERKRKLETIQPINSEKSSKKIKNESNQDKPSPSSPSSSNQKMSKKGFWIIVSNIKQKTSRNHIKSKLKRKNFKFFDDALEWHKKFKDTNLYLRFEESINAGEILKELKNIDTCWVVEKVEDEKTLPERVRDTEEEKIKKNWEHHKEMREIRSKENSITNAEDKVTPWHATPYENQIQKKYKITNNYLYNNLWSNLLKKKNREDDPEILTIFQDVYKKYDMIHSPKIEGYRNKSEFSILYDLNKKITPGFLLGCYFEGYENVGEPYNCRNTSNIAKTICKKVQTLLEKYEEELKPYSKSVHNGFWRLLCIRENKAKEVLITLQVNPKYEVKEDTMKQLKKEIVELLTTDTKIETFGNDEEGKNENYTPKGIFIEHHGGVSNFASPDAVLEKIHGEDTIVEHINGKKFFISPSSFFQVNIGSAELMYSKIEEWAEIDEDTNVLDICCGTGTIGLIMSEKAKGIIGFEIIESAVEDAKKSAEINGVTNAKYICGPVEKTLYTEIENERLICPGSKFVAILDPPRSGLHNKVLEVLRGNQNIERIVYAACNYKTFVKDIEILSKKASNKYKFDPFRLVKFTGVDMFPHTDHCEVIGLLERGSLLKKRKEEELAQKEAEQNETTPKDLKQ